MPFKTQEDSMKHHCRTCGKRVEEGNSTFTCNSCTKFNEARCNKPITEKEPTILPELRFFFHKTAITDIFQEDGLDLTGCFRIDSKDKTKWSIHIYLFSYSIMELDLIKKIGITISHEYLHKCIGIDASESSAVNSMADSSGLMIRLRDGGYFGF
jgi:hypothetical protein